MSDCKGCMKKREAATSQSPVADAVEESYRQAFLRESRKTSELASRVAQLEAEGKLLFSKYLDMTRKLELATDKIESLGGQVGPRTA